MKNWLDARDQGFRDEVEIVAMDGRGPRFSFTSVPSR
jgi:hypothetical protein